MQDPINLDGGDRGALQRRQQNPAQRIAERQAKAALERLGHDRGHASRFIANNYIEFAWLDKLLPILLNHDRTFPWCNSTAASVSRSVFAQHCERIGGT